MTRYRLIHRKRGHIIQSDTLLGLPSKWEPVITYPRYLRFFAGIHLLWLRERARKTP